METYEGEGYCVKCKGKRPLNGEVHETNGRRIARGQVPRVRHHGDPHSWQGHLRQHHRHSAAGPSTTGARCCL